MGCPCSPFPPFPPPFPPLPSCCNHRAVELLLLPAEEPCLVLDIGCGSGLSGAVLEEHVSGLCA